MKKLTAILLTLCICATVVGCGENTGTEKKGGGATPSTPAPAKTTPPKTP